MNASVCANPAERRTWLALLARASCDELEAALHAAFEGAPWPAFDWLRAPETGLAMVRGRTGGTGDPFNVGEASVTRAVLRLKPVDGATPVGIAYQLGRDARRAELAALADAALQLARMQRGDARPSARARRTTTRSGTTGAPCGRRRDPRRILHNGQGRMTMADYAASLENLAPGFADPVHDAQAVFRVLLDALARPGRTGWIETAPGTEDGLAGTPPAALATLLALGDYATPVWLQSPDAALASTIRFHTGAPLADAPGDAVFAYVDDARALPAPGAFALGDAQSPERAATVLIRVEAFEGGPLLTLTGPGIETQALIAPMGIADGFWLARAALAQAFPCGIDCYLVCGHAVIGIPRTTRVELS